MPNPHSEDAAFWRAALEAYHMDRVDEARRQIEHHGIGEAGTNIRWYRLIEAEALLRERGSIQGVNEWLSLESVPEETLRDENWIGSVAVQAATSVADALGWAHGPPVLLSVLCRESETPWATNPHGYWVNKEPYDKICLPYYLLDDGVELARAVAHEYAHVVCGGLSGDNAPTWLHEAISVSVEEAVSDAPVLEKLPLGKWRNVRDLERMLDLEVLDEPEEVFIAYQQCGWIGAYLSSVAPSRQLGALLSEQGNETLAGNLMQFVRGEDRVTRALSRVYGFGVLELFDRARRFMQSA